jgi:fibronectin-binding autotransporter adhesin
MRHGRSGPAAVAGLLSVPLLQAAAMAAPAYTIIPFSPLGTDTIGTGQGISSSGNFAAGYTQRSNGANGVLYNVSSNTSTLESQTGIIYGASTVENYGAPFSVNNSGVMFGSSGASSTVTTGAPTVWQNGSAYNLPLPLYSGAGQVYGCNNLNLAVGTVGSASGGLDQAALFHYYGPNSSSNYTSDLTEPTTNGGKLQNAYGINDSYQIVGTANDPNNAALTVPFFLDLGAGATTATIIPTSSPAFNSAIPFAISNNGLVTGSESLYGSSGQPFLYNNSSGTTVQIPLVTGSSQGGARGVNSSGEVVGTDSGQYALPYLFDGTSSYLLSSLLVNNTSGAWHLSDNTSSGGFGIADNGDVVGRGYYNGVLTGFVMVPTGGSIVTPQNLTFNNTGGTGDGATWDTAQQNFNNGSSATAFSSAAGDYVTFNDVNNGHYVVTIPVTVTPGSTTVNNSAGNYVFSGAGIGGSGGLVKSGTGSLTLNMADSYTGTTSVSGGALILALAGALPKGTNLYVSGTSTWVVASSVRTAYALQVGSLIIYSGTLDLQNNDLIVHSGTLASVTTSVANGYNRGGWNGSTGIVSSLAGATNPTMALGVILNDNGAGTKTPLYGSGGTIAASFGGATPVDGDILVKYTYYGDTNLDGKVDGSDYSLIDNGYAKKLTGWLNGDLNYDGVIDGTDYALIDNAFNNQGVRIAALTAQVAGSVAPAAVPEPASLGLLGAAAACLATRRRRA